jgi:ketosteroid isomerase-like protein
MALTRKTVVDTVQIDRAGNISVRLGLLIMDDDKEIDCKWHRFAAAASEDPEVLLADVEGDLVSKGIPAVAADGKETLRLAKKFRADVLAVKPSLTLETPIEDLPIRAK